MRAHEQGVRQVNEKGRKAEHDCAHELREADVSFRKAVMQEVAGLYDQERNVRVACIQTGKQITRVQESRSRDDGPR